MEVGALLVGKIKNHHSNETSVIKGTEKGMFMYGGSTIILLLQNDVKIKEELFEKTKNGIETPVLLGERLNII